MVKTHHEYNQIELEGNSMLICVVDTHSCVYQSLALDVQNDQSEHPIDSVGGLKTPNEYVPPLPLHAL